MSMKKKDEIIGMVAVGDEQKYIFTASEKGYGKRTETSSYRIQRRGGKGLINLKITSRIGPAVAVLGVGEDDLLVVTVSGKVIRIKTQQIRSTGRATQGVRIINLEDDDLICGVAIASESE
jgi:DNA gyrase subunit A